jgi:hypothetical protein
MWPSMHIPSQRLRLNKFVRRLHDMLVEEKDSGIVEWRRGVLVLHSTDAFTKSILPKHFNTRNFKTFRRQVREARVTGLPCNAYPTIVSHTLRIFAAQLLWVHTR